MSNLSRPDLFAYLSKLPCAAERLELVELNLRSDSDSPQWEAAFANVEYVMHLASPPGQYADVPG